MKITDDLLISTTNYDFTIKATSAYFVGIFLLSKLMLNFKPFKFNSLLRIYNISQIILNLYMIYGLRELFIIPNIFNINKTYNDTLKYYVYIHYLSKYFDFFDTFFIITRGKTKEQLSFLHIYHHSSIACVWAYIINLGHGNGTTAFCALINSIIHMIMYTHYYVTSYGINNPFKKYITKLQILQFYSCILHSFIVVLYENIVPKKLALFELSYHISMIFLFSNFYNKTYNKKITI